MTSLVNSTKINDKQPLLPSGSIPYTSLSSHSIILCSPIFSQYTLTIPSAAAAKSLQSCPTLCDPIDGNPPGSPVPGILQARTLEWGAISFSSHESEK